MSVTMRAELGGEGEEPAVRSRYGVVHMRVVAHKWRMRKLRQDGDAGGRMTTPQSPQERSGEEYIADGAEANGQNVGS